jgi:heme/copper-type cytochrome/quinol oxidase subunit 2
VAQLLLVGAGGVFVMVYGLLAGDLMRTRAARDETARPRLKVELAETLLPLLAVLATIMVAVAGLGKAGPR